MTKKNKGFNWDGKSRVVNDLYRKNYNEIFGKKINLPTFFTVFDEESAIDINKLNQK